MKLLWLMLTILALCAAYRPKELPQVIVSYFPILRTGKIPHELTKSISQIGKIRDKGLKSDVFCATCNLVFTEVLEYRQTGTSKESMSYFFLQLCKAFTDWGPVACQGYIDIELDTVLYIIDNNKNITSKRVCAILFQEHSCEDPDAKKWVINLPPVLPTKNATLKQHCTRCQKRTQPLKILHLTDFHYDPEYSPGSNAQCDLPLCCQKSDGPAANTSQAAGLWGDYHVCDTPWHTITNFTHYLGTTNETYDFVYYTGDIISHKSWASNKQANTDAVHKLMQLFDATFKNVSILPIVGNHEPHPTDFWSYQNVTPSVSTQWVFDLMAQEWSKWLPTSTATTIRHGGYYTVKVSNTTLRIVALNSNVCFTSNLWLIYDDEDPYGQLDWLVKVLAKAEKDGEIVHILSHIPPGELTCHQRWSNQYKKIIQRFAPIIAAQFNGHTHTDELRLFRDVNDTAKIINVAFNAGSFTTFVGFNPNYRTYDVDANSFRVLNYQHYTFNLTEANLGKDPPKWFQLYSFKDAYSLEDTTYGDYADLLTRMSRNNTSVQKYWRFQGRESEPWLAQKCDGSCLKNALCRITAVETQEAVRCQL